MVETERAFGGLVVLCYSRKDRLGAGKGTHFEVTYQHTLEDWRLRGEDFTVDSPLENLLLLAIMKTDG